MEIVKVRKYRIRMDIKISRLQGEYTTRLRKIVESMRPLSPPTPAVANVDGGCLLAFGESFDFGLFDDINASHRQYAPLRAPDQ
jgi:hypothetical protein